MSRSHFTIEGSWQCFTIATLFNPSVGHDHLSHGGHVQHVLAVVLLGEIDVVEEEGEVFEHPLSKEQHFTKTFLVVLHLGQVHVDGGAHQEAHVEHRLSHLGTNSCWQRCPFQGKKYKNKNTEKIQNILLTAPRHSTSQQCCVYFSGHFSYVSSPTFGNNIFGFNIFLY